MSIYLPATNGEPKRGAIWALSNEVSSTTDNVRVSRQVRLAKSAASVSACILEGRNVPCRICLT